VKICVSKDRYAARCAAYGSAYRAAMEAARVPNPNKACFEKSSPGWAAAVALVAALPAEMTAPFAAAASVALAPDKWPVWATIVAGRRQEGDTGLGDTIARELGSGIETVKLWFKSKGITCGCDERRERLNAVYPYRE
jgi:hypothetical protein